MSSESVVVESGEPAAPSVEPTIVTGEPAAPSAPVANWRDSLSADLRSNPTLEQIPDIETLAKNHVNVQKLIGGDKIALPQEGWGEDELNNFYTKLGRPAKAEDYDLEGLERPEGVPFDDEFEGAMVGEMHKLGLNSDQVKGILGFYNNTVGNQHQEQAGEAERTRTTGVQDLKNEWGKSFDAQVDLAKRAFMAGAGDSFEQLAAMPMADGGLLGDHPAVIKAFAALGGKMSEHGLVGTAQRSTMSPGEAGGEIRKLMSDPDFLSAYTDSNHLEHEIAVKRINDLTEAEVGTE